MDTQLKRDELTDYRLDELGKTVARIEALLVSYDARTQLSVDKLGARVGQSEIDIATVATDVKRFYWMVGIGVPATGIVVGIITALVTIIIGG